MDIVRGKDNCLVLGVTGGIASGKSTVVKMLKELGAPVIDLDVIAKQVVQPGKPAWKEIVDYFGKQILQEDGTIDRKRLSKIVFRDVGKRKKLETLTHPRIHGEFIKQLNKIVEKDSKAIVQVDIPLLVEQKLQYMFHKILVVYIPVGKQIERLAERDGSSKEEAAHRVKAQLAIDEKLAYADFVIYNDKSLEETKKQVEELWRALKAIQKKTVKSKAC